MREAWSFLKHRLLQMMISRSEFDVFFRWQQRFIGMAHFLRRAQREEDMPQAQVFSHALEFLRTNQSQDNWFLQIETFDPHEPFYTQQHYKALYPHPYSGPHFDWPDYAPVTQSAEAVEHIRYEYAALVSMCDHYLGQVFDAMDELAIKPFLAI